jgi:hypothetical protein
LPSRDIQSKHHHLLWCHLGWGCCPASARQLAELREQKKDVYNFRLTLVAINAYCVRVLYWWPDLSHIYTACYYTSQSTIWHTMSSLFYHLRGPSQDTRSILFSTGLRSLLYSLGTAPNRTHSFLAIPLFLQRRVYFAVA